MKIITRVNIILALLILLPMQLTYADVSFSIANKSSNTARVAYAVYVSESHADTIGMSPGWHVKGWFDVQSGSVVQLEETLYNTSVYVYTETSDSMVTEEGIMPWRVHPKKNFAYVADSSGKILSVSSGITEEDLSEPEQSGFAEVRAKKVAGQVQPLVYKIPGPLEVVPSSTSFDLFNGDYKKYGKDYALLFATNEYDLAVNLKNPINDATAISKELEKYGFEVSPMPNVTTANIIDKLREYTDPTLYGPDSQLFIFFAGHGVYDPDFGEGHIAGKNSEPEDNKAYDSFLSYERIRHILDGLPCQNILLMLDVCYGGTFDHKNQLTQGSTRAFVEKEYRTAKSQKFYTGPDRDKLIKSRVGIKTRWYMSSGGAVKVNDGSGDHSPYATAILNALRSGGGSDGVLTISEVEQHILNVYDEKKIPYRSASGPFGSNQKPKGFLFIR